MNVIQRITPYAYKKPTKKEAVNMKMKILKEFCIVNRRNAGEIELYLWDEIEKHPDKDYELVLDHAARTLIERKLNEV